MGSALGTCEEVVDELLMIRGEKVGVLKVRLFRPSPPNICYRHCGNRLQRYRRAGSHQKSGAQAEPLYLDVMTALAGSL